MFFHEVMLFNPMLSSSMRWQRVFNFELVMQLQKAPDEPQSSAASQLSTTLDCVIGFQ
jgi:hypothetical protein